MKYRSAIAIAIAIAIVTLFLSASPAFADSLDVVKGDITWHPFETPSLNGNAYWNNSSYDGGQECNVGYWLSGSGGCSALAGTFLQRSPRLSPQFLGDETTGFQLTKDPNTVSITVTNHVTVTAYRATNEVGWFDTTNPLQLFPLLTPTATSATFLPSGSYGFYIKSPEGTYYSTGGGDATSHFAVFQLRANGRYFVGVEDMWVSGDSDYNDIVFDMDVSEVPEPATMVLVGGGMAWLGVAMRRRRARNR